MPYTVCMKTAGFAHPPRNVAVLGIEPGMSIADFGSGSGAYVLLIAEALRGAGEVYAIDVQKDLLRRTYNEALKRRCTNVTVLWGDLELAHGSKLADATVDLVLISNLLFQVEMKSAVLAEAIRVVRKGGRVAVIDWTDSFGGMGPTRDMVFGKDAAREVAKESGLTFQKEFAAGAHHYGLIFRKD